MATDGSSRSEAGGLERAGLCRHPGPVLYYVFRAVYGGPATPSREAGNDALALAEAEAAEDAV